MGPKDILVHVDGEGNETAKRRTEYALSLAMAQQCHVTGLVMALQPTMPPMVMGEVPGTLLESQRKSALEAARNSMEGFVQAAERWGVSYERRLVECIESAASGTFASHARVSDLVIAGQSGPDDLLALHELLIEAALFDSGRPVLIVPYIERSEARFDRVLVAWDGGREAARAVHDALPLLSPESTVEVLVVGDNVPAARSQEPGADLALHLARHDLKATAKRTGGKGIGAADAILSYASDFGADLIVMGGYGHSRLRQMVMGGATRGVLESMTVPVLMSH